MFTLKKEVKFDHFIELKKMITLKLQCLTL